MISTIREKVFKSKPLMKIGFATAFIIFALSIVLCILRGFADMRDLLIFNTGTDVLSIGVCLVIYFDCMMDANGLNENTGMFVILVLVNEFALFFDALSCILFGLADYVFLNRLANALLYANGSVVIYLFWRYVTYTLGMEIRRRQTVTKVLNFLLLPDVLIKLANAFFPIYFTVDNAGIYERGSLFGFSYVYLGIVMFTLVVELVGSKVSTRQKMAAVSFITIPVLNQLLIGRGFGLSIQYSATLLSIVLIYGVLFADRGRTLAATEREMSTAAGIQADALPSVFPAYPERTDFDIYASMTPAKEVGGDFYDFFMLDEDHIALLIADVSGKGVPAALFMMMAKIQIEDHAKMGLSPKEVLERTNEAILCNNKDKMFVTVWFGILEISTGKIIAANAGHEYPLIRQPGKAFELFKDKHGFVLGAVPGKKYQEYEFTLEKGGTLFVYTDGVPEATRGDNELFGNERMLDAINEIPDGSPQELLTHVHGAVNRFVGGAPQFDDLTMLAIKLLR